MLPCNYSSQIDRFHDGELAAAEVEELTAHLAGCVDCSEQLARLQETSALFSAAVRPALSQMGLHRLHHRVADEMDRGLVRLAGALSGIAAGIMLMGSVWLLRAPGDGSTVMRTVPQTPPPWVGVAVSLDTDKLTSDVATPAAQWYLADASRSNDEQP